MSDLKKYNIFIFITSFAKLLVEIFIPLILYNMSFTIKEIILFLILKYSFCLLFIPVGYFIGKKYSVSTLMILSSIIFSITYIYLSQINKNLTSLIILSILYSSYLMFYWLGRHTYGLSIIEDKKTTDNVSLYNIFTILGGLFSPFIGSYIIEKTSTLTLSTIVLVLMIISIIPLTKIKKIKLNPNTQIKHIIKSFPKTNYIFNTLDQLRYILYTVLPLWIYINIKSKYSYIGILNIITGLGSIIYIYLLSKKMDKNKKDYLSLSLLIMGTIYFLKITITSNLAYLIITLFEGITKSSLDTITLRNTYVYQKNYCITSYIIFTEIINNIARTLFLIIFYIFNVPLKTMLLICILGIFLNVFVKYDDGKYGYSLVK
mgnify:FL=1